MVSLGTANTVFSPERFCYQLMFFTFILCIGCSVWTTCSYKWLLSPSWQGPSALYKSFFCHLYGSSPQNKTLISPCLSFSSSQGLYLGCSERVGTFWWFAYIPCWCQWCLPAPIRNFFLGPSFFLSLPFSMLCAGASAAAPVYNGVMACASICYV